MGNYTLDQAQRDIADLRGQIAHLAAYTELLTLVVDTQFTAPDGSVWTTSGLSLASGKYITTDTWHSLGTLSITGLSFDHARYRFTSEGEVEIDINFSTSGTVANNFYGPFSNTLPTAYQPSTGRMYPVGVSGSTVGTGRIPAINITTGGGVSISLPSLPSGVTGGCNIRMPLD